jgi:hypothetical protein
MTTVALYARVSTKNKGQLISITTIICQYYLILSCLTRPPQAVCSKTSHRRYALRLLGAGPPQDIPNSSVLLSKNELGCLDLVLHRGQLQKAV